MNLIYISFSEAKVTQFYGYKDDFYKEFAKEGTIEKAYSNLFVVKYEENDRTASYTYTDLLTRTVEVDVFNGEEYSPLIPPVPEEKNRKRCYNNYATQKNIISLRFYFW